MNIPKENIDNEEKEVLEQDLLEFIKFKKESVKEDIEEPIKFLYDIINVFIKNPIIQLNMGYWIINEIDDSKTISHRSKEIKEKLTYVYKHLISTNKLVIIFKNRIEEIKKYKLEYKFQDLNENIKKITELLTESITQINMFKSNSTRDSVTEMKNNLKKTINQLIDKKSKIINEFNYIDSLIKQQEFKRYEVEDHLIKEIITRYFLKNYISKIKSKSDEQGTYSIDIGYLKLVVIDTSKRKDLLKYSKYLFSEEKRKDQITDFIKNTGEFITNDDQKNRINFLYNEINKINPCDSIKNYQELSKGKKTDVPSFIDELFFNDGRYLVVLSDGIETNHIDREFIGNQDKFINNIINLMIFKNFKFETFTNMIASISEPLFFKYRFGKNYKNNLLLSWSFVKKILIKQYQQGDISRRDYFETHHFMKKGYDELNIFLQKIDEDKPDKYINFLDKPYKVHQLMIFILNLAIFSEGRAIKNKMNDTIPLGRDMGFEGGNTIASHGYNNYLKFEQILSFINPKIFEIYKTQMSIKGFLSWITMALHDAGTYDNQNIIPFSKQLTYGFDNKSAHKDIGGYILSENELIKELFKVDDKNLIDEDVNTDIQLITNIIRNHDYGHIFFDLKRIGYDMKTDNIKLLIYNSISGISDNSAGIGVMNAKGEILVDNWSEKGSDIFSVAPADGTNNLSNANIFCILLV